MIVLDNHKNGEKWIDVKLLVVIKILLIMAKNLLNIFERYDDIIFEIEVINKKIKRQIKRLKWRKQ